MVSCGVTKDVQSLLMRPRAKATTGSVGILLLVVVAVSASCATAPGADPVVVRAEQLWEIGFSTVNAFLKIEKSGDLKILRTAQIHAFAEKLRQRKNPVSGAGLDVAYGLWVFDQLDNAIRAYKANRSANGKASLESWLAVVLEIVKAAQSYMGGQEARYGNPAFAGAAWVADQRRGPPAIRLDAAAWRADRGTGCRHPALAAWRSRETSLDA